MFTQFTNSLQEFISWMWNDATTAQTIIVLFTFSAFFWKFIPWAEKATKDFSNWLKDLSEAVKGLCEERKKMKAVLASETDEEAKQKFNELF